MGRKVKVDLQGKETQGEVLRFKAEEGWNLYDVEDGTQIKLKTVVSDIIRLETRKANGEPIYYIKSTNVVTSDVPEQLRRQPTEKTKAN